MEDFKQELDTPLDEEFDLIQEQLAFIKLVIDSENCIKSGNVMPLDEVIYDL